MSRGPSHDTGRRRGGIAGRWTKPAAGIPRRDLAVKVTSPEGGPLGELYSGSIVAPAWSELETEATWSNHQGFRQSIAG